MKERLYYNLGWDYASFGLPIDSLADPAEMQAGHREGKAHFGAKHKQADIFERKWLQLRKNALKRNRQFDDDVTPAFLKYIQSPVCPITQTPLTNRTQTESDWSVDRVCNIGAYAQSNLAVMSTFANSVKGSMTIQEIRHFVDHPEDDERLSKVAWQRLFALCQHVHMSADLLALPDTLVMPVIAYYPTHLGLFWTDSVQYALIAKLESRVYGKKPHLCKSDFVEYLSFYSQIKKSCDDTTSTKLFNKLMARLERKFATVPFSENLFWDDHTWKIMDDLLSHQRMRNRWPFKFENKYFESVEFDAKEKAKELAIAQKGYMPV